MEVETQLYGSIKKLGSLDTFDNHNESDYNFPLSYESIGYMLIDGNKLTKLQKISKGSTFEVTVTKEYKPFRGTIIDISLVLPLGNSMILLEKLLLDLGEDQIDIQKELIKYDTNCYAYISTNAGVYSINIFSNMEG